ncbi:MAG: bifunctional [glutamate--ammonia ligase]-adenylyl-L-tyrosine phosphorylase/[glutamate--ammonia-ligase] adenylyltransferase [Thermodesulfobacteria bacterium]|nr:bifunctional [glutamate--ammonia ligase]-adenylyl-L-tyrosine phosphorylase/[glutamate--ammonia-ligase] adenylyltransferase [Thermodesulfobacteriota bacterium]
MKEVLDAYSLNLSLAVQNSYPPELRQRGRQILTDILANCQDAKAHLTAHKEEILEKVLPLSIFVKRQLQLNPDYLLRLLHGGYLSQSLGIDGLEVLASKMLELQETEDDFSRALRRFRNFVMTQIAIRDIGGLAPLSATLGELSDLARICLERTLCWLEQDMAKSYGYPQDEEGKRVRLAIIGMGKLGARELNFSSDIDIIFAYRERGKTSGGARVLSNEEYFLLQARRLIQILSRTTPEGFVFRVDTRLRPFGDSGPLVLSFDAMCEYYENHGRQWERYALVKASAVAGDIRGGQGLLQSLGPFIYRKYIDYSTVEALKEMKAMILAEQAGKSSCINVKLGPGGIRDVEFVVQTFQLIKGGRVKALQVPGLLDALEVIKSLGLLDEKTCINLGRAYVFLRVTENRLQEYEDRQVQCLPDDGQRRQILSTALGYDCWDDFYEDFLSHTRNVERVFKGLFHDDYETESQEPEGEAKAIQQATVIWSDPVDEASLDALARLGFQEPEAISKYLRNFKESKKVKTLSGQVQELLDKLVPRLIASASDTENPDRALRAALAIFEAILKRSIYLVLLYQNPPALNNLVYLCSKSRLIAQLLERQPILLDELVNEESLFRRYEKDELEGLLRATLAALSRKDLEHWLDELRRFKKANVLRVAACQLKGVVGVEDVGRELSNLAECTLAETFSGAWSDVEAKAPDYFEKNISNTQGGLAIIAYGKLGSREMTYSSDLDLVFLYNQDRFGALGEAQRAQLNYFYSRVIQRLIFFLSTRTSQGVLYEIDTRLRPNGSQGILVSSLDNFRQYQSERAWTWEHQALIKARYILGDTDCGRAFEDIRASVLRMRRDDKKLRGEIAEMRQKIIRSFGSAAGQKGKFHIKKSPGGLVDIEFIIQYLVLKGAFHEESLVQYRGTCELIDVLRGVGMLEKGQAEILKQAFLLYQERVSLKALDIEEPVVPLEELDETRKGVLETWSQILG